jgi:hypothetical protein
VNIKVKAQNLPYAAAVSAACLVLQSSSRPLSLGGTRFEASSSGAVESGGELMVEQLSKGSRWRRDGIVSRGARKAYMHWRGTDTERIARVAARAGGGEVQQAGCGQGSPLVGNRHRHSWRSVNSALPAALPFVHTSHIHPL